MALGAESAPAFRDRYRLLELVGEGANARVYTADDLTLHRRVAVKVLREEWAADEDFRRRFEQEMRAASMFSFPRLLPVYDWGLDPVPHVVTEHVTGGSLADMLAAGHRLSPSQALAVGLEVARALANIHRAGGAYCGLTASSLMFDSQARVFLSDLGVAAALAASGLGDSDPAVGAAADPGVDESDPTARTAADPGAGESDPAVGAAADPGVGGDRAESESPDAEAAFSVPDAEADDAGSADEDPWGIGDDRWDTEVWDIETWGLEDPGSAGAAQAGAGTAGADRTESRRSPAERQQDVNDLALILVEAMTGLRVPPGDVGEGLLSISVQLGPLNASLERATSTDPADRLDAAGLVEEMLRVARVLPRPDPLPIVLAEAAPVPVRGVGSLVAATSAPTEAAERADPARLRRPGIPLDDVVRRRWPGLVLAMVLVLGGAFVGVWAWIDTRPETVAVPELAGLDRAAAAQSVSERGWEVSEILVREPGTRPGEVVRTDPPAGAELGEGSAVALFVSLGEPLVVLDFDLYGHTVLDATALLEERGLAVEGEVPVNDEGVPAGLVVGLDLAAGIYELEPASSVGLRVSEGPAARSVPDVPAERTPISAVQALYDVRLESAEVSEFSAEVPEGEVIGFRPASGTSVAADSVVEIVVSMGPEPPPPEPEAPDESGDPGEADEA